MACCIRFLPLNAQDNTPTKIKLLNADQLTYDDQLIKARKLLGNVRFKHKDALMTCDSAYMFTQENRIKAYSNVVINQGDSVFLYGDSLDYNGDNAFARLRGAIKLIDSGQVLTTNHLDYNMETRTAYYLGGGTIVKKDSSGTLTSEKGYYNTATETFFFKNKVRVKEPDYRIESDTLEYNTAKDKTFFHGPTKIISDSSIVYCERGWYDRLNKLAQFVCNVEVIQNDQELRGDSLFYNQNTGIGEVFRDVQIYDTTNRALVTGDYATYNELDSTSLVTGNLELIQLFDRDSLFLHADTFYTAYDSTGINRQIFAYHHVKYYKSDLQGKCDSMVFNRADSSIFMFSQPVVWSKANQMVGDTIQIITYSGKIDHMLIYQNAYVTAAEDTNKYNQIKGRVLTAYFDSTNSVKRIDVEGNGQTIYYGKEEDGDYLGLNRLDCSRMKIMTDSNQIEQIFFYVKPEGTFYPMKDVTPDLKVLSDFTWLEHLQPKRREDIFIWFEDTRIEEE